MSYTCPKCKEKQIHKSREDEKFYEFGILNEYIHCWWCNCLMFLKKDGEIAWSLEEQLKNRDE